MKSVLIDLREVPSEAITLRGLRSLELERYQPEESGSYVVSLSYDGAAIVRALPGFASTTHYCGSIRQYKNEMGALERYRFLLEVGVAELEDQATWDARRAKQEEKFARWKARDAVEREKVPADDGSMLIATSLITGVIAGLL